jgi:hypothetical protein
VACAAQRDTDETAISRLESGRSATDKGVEPTAAGIALLNHARRVLHELDEVFVQMREYANGIRGHVRVFANISAITQFLPAEIKSLPVLSLTGKV